MSYIWDGVSLFAKLFNTGKRMTKTIYHGVVGYIDRSILVKVFPSLAIPHNVAFFMFLTVILVLLALFLVFRHVKNEVVQKKKAVHETARFRKRDKLRYYVSRFGRRFSEMTEKLNEIKSQEDRRLLIIAFVKRILNIPDEPNAITLNRCRLSESFFEPDEEEDSTLPDDLKLMISSLRVFGHLEKSFFIEFCKFIETIRLEKNQFLFRIGDADEYMYVINSGRIQLYVVDNDGSRSMVNEVTKGGSIDSFFSVLKVLTNDSSVHDSIEAVAVEPSVVLRLPTRSFLDICKPQTPALMRILQMITVRLQRLTFIAVQNQLGLYSELLHQEPRKVGLFKFQQVLDAVEAKERTSISSFEGTIREPTNVYISSSFEHGSRQECDPFDKNTISSIIDEFPSEFTPDVKLPSSHNICDGLELGEVPSRALKEKPLLASRSSTPTKDLEERVRTTKVSEGSNISLPNVQDNESLSTAFSRAPFFRTLNFDEEEKVRLLEAVQEDIAQLLNLPNSHLLTNHVVLASVPSGTTLLEEYDMQMEIYFIVTGELHAVQSIGGFNATEFSTLLVCRPGELVGLLGLITGEPNVYSLKSVKETVMGVLSRESFFTLVRQNPETLFSAIRFLASRVSPLLHHLDFAIQWISIDAGKALYKQSDPANHVYVVLSGRLRQIDSQSDGGRQIAGELGRGDLVGFLEVICSQSRVHTVMAIRDSEVAQIPALLLQYLKEKVPQVLTRIVKLLSDRLLGNVNTTNQMTSRFGLSALSSKSSPSLNTPVFSKSIGEDDVSNNFPKTTMFNLRTIAILPATGDINAEAFTLELQHSMTPIGSSVRLTSRIIKKRLGATALDSVNQYRLSAWLSHQEDLHRIVFFVCNSSRYSAWNRLCIRQADCVLVLALGTSDPSKPSPIEMALKNHPTKVAKALVLMYPLDTDYPMSRQTAKWLNVRPWISHHYHIRCEPRVFTPRSPENLLSFYSHVFAREKPNPLSDFSRLARYLTGEAIGLVLGGGGARGCAHAGVIRAFQDAGVPIDLIGGTSMGAFMSALWAGETRFAQFTQRARKFTDSLNSIWNKIKDFTYPAVSIFSGKEFNAQLEKVFGERQVEDLWIPSFYVTTDITNCSMRVHTQGSLWRYVRASMSLSGYLPPLCDPYDGSLLLDGGYTNNVPADVMASFGAKTIFAVDVGATVDTDFTNYGDHLSGWSFLYNSMFRSSSSPFRVPHLTEIQSRLAYISCVRQLEKIKQSGICHYMRPPIDRYMTLQFSAFDEILAVGYDYAKSLLCAWHEEDKLKHLVPGLRPGSLFDQPNLATHIEQTRSRPDSIDGTLTPSAVLTQNFDGPRSFIDLAETFSSLASGHRSRFHSSDTEDDSTDHRGNGKVSNAQRRPSSGVELLNSLMGKHWRKRPAVRSLSEAVYSYLNSASRMVSQTLPDGVFFRRRALSASFSATPADPSSSSEEAGHYSDALDTPVLDTTHQLTELRHRRQSASLPQANQSNLVTSGTIMGSNVDFLRNISLHQSTYDDDGYLEDNESADEHLLSWFSPNTVESDPELSHTVLHDVDENLHSLRRRFRSSTMIHTSSDDHRPSEGVNYDSLSVSLKPSPFPHSELPQIRKRRRRRRGSLNKLRQTSLSSPLTPNFNDAEPV